jgi:cbb3-type cytochrome oxidase maturation protein
MELTWIAIAASLLMGAGGLLIFVWAVRSHQFKSFEDVKYQVFWSDLEDPAPGPGSPAALAKAHEEEQQNGTNPYRQD